MSLPQIPAAPTRSSTCPGPGTGTGSFRTSAVLLPGRYTPRMVAGSGAVVSLMGVSFAWVERVMADGSRGARREALAGDDDVDEYGTDDDQAAHDVLEEGVDS